MSKKKAETAEPRQATLAECNRFLAASMLAPAAADGEVEPDASAQKPKGTGMGLSAEQVAACEAAGVDPETVTPEHLAAIMAAA